MTPNEKRPHQDCAGLLTQVQASVEILSPVPVSGICSEKAYERLFIRDPEVKAREGKMAYVRPEYHERIMRITRVTVSYTHLELKKSLRNLIQKDSDPQLVKFVNSIDKYLRGFNLRY